MRFPNWVCKDCGKPFSRKWNGKRHINICHHGFGTLLSFIDYLSGRQFGIYLQIPLLLIEESRLVFLTYIWMNSAEH